MDEQAGLHSALRVLGVTLRALYREMQRLGLHRPDWQYGPLGVDVHENDARRTQMRGRFLALKESHPTVGRTQLRRLEPHLCAWLGAHDSEWWKANAPAGEKRGSADRVAWVDWEARDRESLMILQEGIRRLRLEHGPTRRITIRAVVSVMRARRYIAESLDRLPLTKAYFEQASRGE